MKAADIYDKSLGRLCIFLVDLNRMQNTVINNDICITVNRKKTFISFVSVCNMFQSCGPSSGINKWRWSTEPKHVAYTDEANKSLLPLTVIHANIGMLHHDGIPPKKKKSQTGLKWSKIEFYILQVARIDFFFTKAQQPPVGQGLLIIEDSWSHSDTPHSIGFLWTRNQLVPETSTLQHTNILAPGGIQTHNPGKRAAADSRLRPLSHWNRQLQQTTTTKRHRNSSVSSEHKILHPPPPKKTGLF